MSENLTVGQLWFKYNEFKGIGLLLQYFPERMHDKIAEKLAAIYNDLYNQLTEKEKAEIEETREFIYLDPSDHLYELMSLKSRIDDTKELLKSNDLNKEFKIDAEKQLASLQEELLELEIDPENMYLFR